MTTTKFEELRQYGCESIRAYNNCLLVKKVPRPEKTAGGIVIVDKEQADSRKDTFPFFEILSIGPEFKGDSLGKPQVGDYVIFERSVRMQLPDGFELWTLPEQQILAIVPNPRRVTSINISPIPAAPPVDTNGTAPDAVPPRVVIRRLRDSESGVPACSHTPDIPISQDGLVVSWRCRCGRRRSSPDPNEVEPLKLGLPK